jgi:hypothetical protein
MNVTCVDNKNKPNEIPNSNWLIEKQKYTVVKLLRNKLTKEYYYKLEEVSPPSPYGGYKITRFAIPIEELEKFCKMFNLDIEKIKEDNEELFEILKKERILEEELI